MYRTKTGTGIKIITKDGIMDFSKVSLISKTNRTIATKLFAHYGAPTGARL